MLQCSCGGHLKTAALETQRGEVEHLSSLRDSRTAPWRETQRARIVLRYHSGENVSQIARAVGMTRKSVDKWIRKALAMGSDAALKDAYHRPKEPLITEEAKAWVIHLACSKPKDLGYAAEVWTRSALARHVREHAPKAGYASLARAAKATVHRILAEQPLHPERVKYYMERRDPEFETKMREVLLVYQEVALQNQNGGGMIPMIITVSVDEARFTGGCEHCPGFASGARQAFRPRPRPRVQTPRHVFDSGCTGPAQRARDRPGRASAS